jgi:hypothetical protein
MTMATVRARNMAIANKIQVCPSKTQILLIIMHILYRDKNTIIPWWDWMVSGYIVNRRQWLGVFRQ